jgi:hypothetical protein
MRTQGSLAEQDFPRLVQALHERRWTGVLNLTHAGAGKSGVVQDGRMVFASSSSKDERLGELMLRRGRITLRQLVLWAYRVVGVVQRLGEGGGPHPSEDEGLGP